MVPSQGFPSWRCSPPSRPCWRTDAWCPRGGSTRRSGSRTSACAPKTTRKKGEAPKGLKAALRNFRSREARRKRYKPYQVFPNAVIDAIVATRPQSAKDLLAIDGMGPTRVRRYSQAILELVREHPG